MTELDEAVKRLWNAIPAGQFGFGQSEDDIRTVLDALAKAQMKLRAHPRIQEADYFREVLARAEAAEAESVRLRTLWEKTDADDLIARADAAEAERYVLQARIDEALAIAAHYAVVPGDTSQPAPSYYVAVGSQVVADRIREALSTPSKEEYQK
ncbi:hypothetical protein [Microbacterium terrisoli]|uniref:hypothetical protein n=1 Tax=Microbacterium terrisoli TaxID=3242192 RepID=UPI002803D956|nr:hypothetical protein [Microbacterium protaetiae]